MANIAVVGGVPLSPGEELRFRQETFAHLRQQRIQQVREREKRRAKNNVKVFQHKQKELQSGEALLAKQQELTTLLEELEQLETLKFENAEQFGEAHAQATHLRAQTMAEAELQAERSLEESKSRAKRFLQALETERAPMMAKALAAAQAAERRMAVRAEEEARAKEAAATAVFPPPEKEEKPPHVVITSDEHGHIDYSKTRFHVWAGGVDGPLGLGPSPKPTPLVSPEEQRENERNRTYMAFKAIRAEKEAQQVEKTLEEAAKLERLLKLAQKPFGVPKTIKVPAPPIVPSREREILWDVTNTSDEPSSGAALRSEIRGRGNATVTPPVPPPGRMNGVHQHCAAPASSSRALHQPASARTAVQSEPPRAARGHKVAHRADIDAPPSVMDDLGASSRSDVSSRHASVGGPKHEGLVPLSHSGVSSRHTSVGGPKHEGLVPLSCSSSSASLGHPTSADDEAAFLTAQEQAWVRRHLAMSIDKENEENANGGGVDITVWSDHAHSPVRALSNVHSRTSNTRE